MIDNADLTVGRRVRQFRLWRDVTLRATAELAGVSPAYLSMVENGQRFVQKRSTLAAIARALRIAPSELGSLPVSGLIDPDFDRTRAGVVDIEAALTDVALGEQTVNPRPWEAIAADVEHLYEVLRPRADLVAQTAMLPGLIRELNAMIATGAGGRHDVLDTLIHVLHSASLAAKYIGARGVPGLGALRMREVAEELDEPRYHGLARFARAQTLGSGGRARMLDLSTTAADDLQSHLTDDGSRQLYGMLHLNAAMAAAATDDAVISAAHLREASDVAASAPDPDRCGWANLSFNRTNVAFWRVALSIELGEAGRVPELSEDIHPELMTSWSRQSAYFTDLGRSLAMNKATRDDAVEALVRAETLAPVPTRTNIWARETVTDLMQRTKRDAPSGRELRGLAYRMGLAA